MNIIIITFPLGWLYEHYYNSISLSLAMDYHFNNINKIALNLARGVDYLCNNNMSFSLAGRGNLGMILGK